MRSARWSRSVLGAIVCALGVSTALSGCSSDTLTLGAPDPALRGEWLLTGGQDAFGPMKLLGQKITLTVSGETISTGRASCSDYTATIYGSLRAMQVTADTPRTFGCTTADQSVLQLEYLTDLRATTHSEVSASALTLSGGAVRLDFTRARRFSVTNLVDKIWQLKSSTTINPYAPPRTTSETGAYLRFDSKSTLTGVTKCVTFNADYRQDADELVASHILAVQSLACDREADQAARDFTSVFDGGFTFNIERDSLALNSSRAELALGFQQLVAS